MIFESHAHYDDEAFEEDRAQLLGQMEAAGIGGIVNVAASIDSVSSTLALAEKYPFIWAALGVHPSETGRLKEADFDWLKKQLAHPKAVAVGEIGLDYYWDEPGRDIQKNWFARQLALAGELNKPVIIHSREAAKDTCEIMKAEGAQHLKGVIHCFSYTKETARTFLDMGYYFGIGGVVTFNNAKKLKEAVAWLPLSQILLETDCPYLAPVPYRGKRNSSLYLPLVAEAIAGIKGISREEVEEVTERNARRLFGLEPETLQQD